MKYLPSFLLILLLSFFACGEEHSSTETVPLSGKRVLILGNSITQHGTYVSVMEYLLRKQFPESSFDLISIGLGSETVSCLTEPKHAYPRPCVQTRLDKALSEIQPEIVLACYGMNDGIYHPQSPERMARYQAGMNEVLASIAHIGAEAIVITPPVFDSLPILQKLAPADAIEYGYSSPYAGYDQVLGDYADWIMEIEQAGVKSIDLHSPMKDYIQKKRTSNPEFTLARDGVHPSFAGHVLMAEIILKGLGLSSAAIDSDQLQDDLLYRAVATRRQTRSEGWLAYIGYVRGDTVQQGNKADIEARVASYDPLISTMQSASTSPKGSFGYDQDFLSIYQPDLITLRSEQGNAQLLLSPAFQGRVMSSTAQGRAGLSHGWINYDLIASGRPQPHINVYGGEERFWLGPEGGQYSIFFEKGAAFDLDAWQTPPLIDTEPFEVEEQTESSVRFVKEASLTNYSDFTFNMKIERDITSLNDDEILSSFGIEKIAETQMVGYRSSNTLTNTGQEAWKKETGLLSIWLLGMFNPSASTTVVVPYEAGPESERGPIVNDSYFGKVPSDRLKQGDGVIYFSGDGAYRSKIGLSPRRAKNVLGAYDAEKQVLTLVSYTKPEGLMDYVNSLWELQDQPYAGDVVNSYNDGPPTPGAKALGPFYELETSSPALALRPEESATHVQTTVHLEGKVAALDAVAKKVLGVSLSDIQKGLGK